MPSPLRGCALRLPRLWPPRSLLTFLSEPFTARKTNTPVAATSVRFAASSPVRSRYAPLRCGLRGRTGAAFLVACCFPLCGEELREANQQQHSGKEPKALKT